MNQTVPTPADAAAEIIANMKRAFDVNALIEDARLKLGVAPAPVDNTRVINLTGAQGVVASNLLAKAEELDKVAKAALAEREAIKQVLADLVDDHAEELRVNNAPVFTYKEQHARVLDQAAVKAAFPDVPGNERFWKDQVTRPRRFR